MPGWPAQKPRGPPAKTGYPPQATAETTEPPFTGRWTGVPWLGRYRSDAVNAAHVSALKLSVPPFRSAVSRTRTSPVSELASTQLPPVSFE